MTVMRRCDDEMVMSVRIGVRSRGMLAAVSFLERSCGRKEA